MIREPELGEGEMVLLVIFCYRGQRNAIGRIHKRIFLIETESQSPRVCGIKYAKIISVKNLDNESLKKKTLPC